MVPTSEILAWLEGFPHKFTLVKALLYEKNCQYLLSLGHFFTILKGFARDKRFSQKESPKIRGLVDKINGLTQVAVQRLQALPPQEPQPGLVALVNFLEDFYFFLHQNNFWLGKSAWDAKKQILNLMLRLGLLDNVVHCLFLNVPKRVDVELTEVTLGSPPQSKQSPHQQGTLHLGGQEPQNEDERLPRNHPQLEAGVVRQQNRRGSQGSHCRSFFTASDEQLERGNSLRKEERPSESLRQVQTRVPDGVHSPVPPHEREAGAKRNVRSHQQRSRSQLGTAAPVQKKAEMPLLQVPVQNLPFDQFEDS